MEIPVNFEVIYNEKVLPVERVIVGNTTLFRVGLIGKFTLVITRATKENGKKFWTSVPEGRQHEAEIIGPLIESYYRANMNK
jgi:hypothetical protein